MLLKKIIIRRCVWILTTMTQKDIVFSRVVNYNLIQCDSRPNISDENDKRCKFNQNCPIKYTCSKVNSRGYQNYFYLPLP